MDENRAGAVRRNWPRRLRRGAILLALVVVAFLAWPSPIDPAAYTTTPPPPWTGPLAQNELLRSAVRLAQGKVAGPEDVAVDDQGRIYGGCADGRIARILPDGRVETFAQTGGRPLGMEFDAEGDLIVCDAVRGLVSVDPRGEVEVLSTESDGAPFGFADDCDVAPDGVVYFSDASDRFGVNAYMLDLLEGRPHGRLLAYDPRTKRTTTLLGGLYFANGVALSPEGDFVLVNETYRYRIRRFWLTGPKARTADVFADNLPGFPDGISRSPRGTFWVAMFTTRNPTADALAPYPWVRKQMAKLPAALWPKPAPYGLVLELDADGNVLRSLHDPGGRTVENVTSVHERDGSLYLGTLQNDYIAKWDPPK